MANRAAGLKFGGLGALFPWKEIWMPMLVAPSVLPMPTCRPPGNAVSPLMSLAIVWSMVGRLTKPSMTESAPVSRPTGCDAWAKVLANLTS